ncbi:hypothetical protein [Brassicibacter mesophilus]|uniref:hypothetical protein n=1 Tax=Brassicibacter mesophilus TaxID=745119 RepID=UPI003D236715
MDMPFIISIILYVFVPIIYKILLVINTDWKQTEPNNPIVRIVTFRILTITIISLWFKQTLFLRSIDERYMFLTVFSMTLWFYVLRDKKESRTI